MMLDTVFPATDQLRRFAAEREGLRLALDDSVRRLGQAWGEDELEDWAAASLELVAVNAGSACLAAFWRASLAVGPVLGVEGLDAFARVAADICRHAGAKAATAFLDGSAQGASLLVDTALRDGWYRGFARLAREAPEGVPPVAERMVSLLGTLREGFDGFVGAGIKASGRDRKMRLAFFSLAHPLARALMARADGAAGFSGMEAMLKTFATALWGQVPELRAMTGGEGAPMPRRTSIVGDLVRVPETFRGMRDETARVLFKATVAHATAHLNLAATRFPVGQLKPLQIALVTLVEDARVERLALERLPGLRALWAPFHVAKPSGAATAPDLLARLSRALFDPAYEDGNGFVRKGRTLFEAAMLERPLDPALSREIGMVLGNDLGQMRVQFNAKDYVIEPVYRDDGYGLWDFGEQPDAPQDMVEISVEAARMEQTEDPDEADREREEGAAEPEETGRARDVPADDHGTIVATYPEWDRSSGIERPDWTTVREVTPRLGAPLDLERALTREPVLRTRVAKLVRGAKIGRAVRLKRQPEGLDLDLEAALDAAIALRAGEAPDARVYRSTARKFRDMAVSVLVDISESTRERVAGTTGSVLDVERLAVAVLAEAMTRLGDPFVLQAFASAGREEVRAIRLKEFDESYDDTVKARLAGLESGLSTRLGAMLRHAGREMLARRSHRKLLLVLTDGEPSDIDVDDPLDLVEDARRAALVLKSQGVDVYGVTLDPAGHGSGERVFGRANHMPIRRLSELPDRLASLYFRLARH